MEELENEKLLREIKPKFNFIYELFMPTGRKMKSALVMCVIAIVIRVFVSLNKASMLDFPNAVIGKFSMIDVLMFFCWCMIIFSIIKFIVHFVFQKMQYEHISYKFYETYMVYEDDFLNQHKKNILYGNVKEVEIRRTIWDRILGMGVVVIYTNAENKRNNGLVVYALDNPKEDYEYIDKLINRYRMASKSENENINNAQSIESNVEEVINEVQNNEQKQVQEKVELTKEEASILEEDIKREQSEEAFKDSLKETN